MCGRVWCGALQEDVAHIRERLQRVHVSARSFNVHCPHIDNHKTLCTQVSLLSSLHADNRIPHVSLYGRRMSSEAVSALRGLPAWSGTLSFRDCIWPEDPAVYDWLGMCVPATYTEWRLGTGVKPDTPLLISICAGINHRRQGLKCQPVTLVLSGAGGGWVMVKVGEHVLLELS